MNQQAPREPTPRDRQLLQESRDEPTLWAALNNLAQNAHNRWDKTFQSVAIGEMREIALDLRQDSPTLTYLQRCADIDIDFLWAAFERSEYYDVQYYLGRLAAYSQLAHAMEEQHQPAQQPEEQTMPEPQESAANEAAEPTAEPDPDPDPPETAEPEPPLERDYGPDPYDAAPAVDRPTPRRLAPQAAAEAAPEPDDSQDPEPEPDPDPKEPPPPDPEE